METELLILGAGPVGLAAALFCKRNGVNLRIIDRRIVPATQSKALAVNPRTLELLSTTGVTEKMLLQGRKIAGARFSRQNGRILGEIPFENLKTEYPFMLGLAQGRTEELLAEAFGSPVERGVEAVNLTQNQNGVVTEFADGTRCHSRLVLAADGAHSLAREKLKVDFDGEALPGDWYLADVALKTELSPKHAHILFNDGPGFYFLLPVIDDDRVKRSGDPIWRVISTDPSFLKDFKLGAPTAKPIWESKFNISHRISHSLRVGSVFFAGDAAHVHSPVGARGMNLGIEDAYVFARLLKEDRLGEYDEERRAVDQSVVRRVDQISHLAVGENHFFRIFRTRILPILLKTNMARMALARAMSGLDHSI